MTPFVPHFWPWYTLSCGSTLQGAARHGAARRAARCAGPLGAAGAVRKGLALKEGDRVVLTVRDDGSVRLASLKQKIRQFQGMFEDLEPEGDWSRELIEQRRKEARREGDG